MAKRRSAFDPKTFLTTAGAGRQLISFAKGQTVYAQGDAADSLFVIQTGSVKLNQVSGRKRSNSRHSE
jgi:CRP-like cAMP-binding protein